MTILDNDTYKFTMQQAVLKNFPDVKVKYKFIDRGDSTYNEEFFEALKSELKDISNKIFRASEIEYLRSLPYMQDSYLEWLKNHQLSYESLNLDLDTNNKLNIEIEGKWVDTILWEVPLLYTISENYFIYCDKHWNYENQVYKARQKVWRLDDAKCKFIEGGTRRRRSFETQKIIVDEAIRSSYFLGTSNVELAKAYNINPMGTMAHEWIMAMSAIGSLENANFRALETWAVTNNGRLGIALTDTYTTKAFLNDFDGIWARVYDGVRQDSGDPFKIGWDIIRHYNSLGINPKTKKIVFSDALDISTCLQLQNEFSSFVQPVFMIGTHFTNDFENSPPLNIVVKLDEVDGTKVCKLSDDDGKSSGDNNAVEFATKLFK